MNSFLLPSEGEVLTTDHVPLPWDMGATLLTGQQKAGLTVTTVSQGQFLRLEGNDGLPCPICLPHPIRWKGALQAGDGATVAQGNTSGCSFSPGPLRQKGLRSRGGPRGLISASPVGATTSKGRCGARAGLLRSSTGSLLRRTCISQQALTNTGNSFFSGNRRQNYPQRTYHVSKFNG